MLALLLALIWTPLMSHCALETVTGLQFLRCGPDLHSSTCPTDHCGNGACCAFESGKFHTPGHQPVVPVFVLTLLPFGLVADFEPVFPPEVSLGVLTSAPPGLSTAWQFSLRAAPLSRAPSLVS